LWSGLLFYRGSLNQIGKVFVLLNAFECLKLYPRPLQFH
jgi:hypothetical protein